MEGNGGYTNDYNTSASVGAEGLKKFGRKFGVPEDVIQMVAVARKLPGREHIVRRSHCETGSATTI